MYPRAPRTGGHSHRVVRLLLRRLWWSKANSLRSKPSNCPPGTAPTRRAARCLPALDPTILQRPSVFTSLLSPSKSPPTSAICRSSPPDPLTRRHRPAGLLPRPASAAWPLPLAGLKPPRCAASRLTAAGSDALPSSLPKLQAWCPCVPTVHTARLAAARHCLRDDHRDGADIFHRKRSYTHPIR